MAISDWPENERPREKLAELGPGALSDAELLAILFRTGTKGATAIDLARKVLATSGGLKGLLEADPRALSSVKGLGPAKTAPLCAALELSRRYLKARLTRLDVLENPQDTAKFLSARLGGYHYEVFACLLLDNRHRVINFEELFRGTIDGASVHPREVVKHALRHNAAAVIFAHNHPSGVAEASHADRAITRRLKDALSLVDIRVLDHVIVGDGDTTSLAEQGLI